MEDLGVTRHVTRPRLAIQFAEQGATGNAGGTNYLQGAGRTIGTSTFGIPMPHPGSILSCTIVWEISVWAAAKDVDVEVRINDIAVFTPNHPGGKPESNGVFTWKELQDPGVDTFSALDIMTVATVWPPPGVTYRYYPFVVVEVEFDD